MKKRKRKKKGRDEQAPHGLSTSGASSQIADDGAVVFISRQTSPLIPDTGPARPNYRSNRVLKEHKKLINVPVDEELKLNARVLMSIERLTWEKLIGKLLLQWVESHPQYPKLL